MVKYTYKELLSEKKFLRVAERARRLNGCQLVAILYKDNMLIFKTLSGTDHKTIWTQRVVIDDLSPRKLRKLKFNQTERVIKWSGLHCACDCYAFRYWGFAYWSYKRGYGLVKETRVPRVRNPYGQGAVCKHLHQVMQVLPFLSKTLAKKFRDNLKPENDAQLESKMSDEELDKKGMKELEDSEK